MTDTERNQKEILWRNITIRARGEQGYTEDGIRVYLATDGKMHFYFGKEWLGSNDLLHQGLMLARREIRLKGILL